MNTHGTGDKYTGAGSASIDDLGLTSQESFGSDLKLRKDTGDMTQRPVAENKKLKTDRGTFTNKC